MLTRAPTIADCPNVKLPHPSNGPALRAASATQAEAHEAQGVGKHANSQQALFLPTDRAGDSFRTYFTSRFNPRKLPTRRIPLVLIQFSPGESCPYSPTVCEVRPTVQVWISACEAGG